MNLFQIFDSIAKVDDAAYDRLDSRRACFKHLLAGGKKVSMAAAPLFLGAVVNKAYAGDQGVRASVLDVLKYALRLERLEFNYYDRGLNSAASTISASLKNDVGLREILANEQSHVALLEGAIGTANLPAADNYNFPKVYTDVFSNDATFMAVAQVLEDTGVRAYKGGVADLKVDPATLEIALNIHSVEARHASHIRRMRGNKGWVRGESAGDETAIGGGIAVYRAGNPASSFPSEANTTQAGLAIGYAGTIDSAADRYSEAFDEPLDMTTVLTLVQATFLV